MTREQFDQYSIDLFAAAGDELKFKPRPDRAIDQKIRKILKLLKIKDVPFIGID